MSATTGIEWTDATWNPVTGCTKVSARVRSLLCGDGGRMTGAEIAETAAAIHQSYTTELQGTQA